MTSDDIFYDIKFTEYVVRVSLLSETQSTTYLLVVIFGPVPLSWMEESQFHLLTKRVWKRQPGSLFFLVTCGIEFILCMYDEASHFPNSNTTQKSCPYFCEDVTKRT